MSLKDWMTKRKEKALAKRIERAALSEIPPISPEAVAAIQRAVAKVVEEKISEILDERMPIHAGSLGTTPGSILIPSDPGDGYAPCWVCGKKREKRGIAEVTSRRADGRPVEAYCWCGYKVTPMTWDDVL